jgi:hypothetical protein
VKKGVLVKVVYQEKPVRYEYKLTRMGLGLYPVLMSLARWGNDWLDEGKGAPVEYIHKSCGSKINPIISCEECGEVIHPEKVIPIPGEIFKTKLSSPIEPRNIPLFISRLGDAQK